MRFKASVEVSSQLALVPNLEGKVSPITGCNKDPAVVSRLAGLGMIADYEPPEKLLAEIREEHRVVEQIAKKAGLVK